MTKPDDKLLTDIQNSIMDIQNQMQNTYQDLSKVMVTGESFDKTVKVTMSATYDFEDIEFNEKALQGGVKEFKGRIREAMNNVIEKIKEATQNKTLELLKNMPIPEEIRNLSMPTDQGAIGQDKKDEKDDEE